MTSKLQIDFRPLDEIDVSEYKPIRVGGMTPLCDASAFDETDPYIAEPRELCVKLAAALSALGEKEDGWLPIESAPKEDTLFLAATDDGRIMIWRGSILARNLAGPTPNHLSFPATHWRPLPAPPAIRAGETDA